MSENVGPNGNGHLREGLFHVKGARSSRTDTPFTAVRMLVASDSTD